MTVCKPGTLSEDWNIDMQHAVTSLSDCSVKKLPLRSITCHILRVLCSRVPQKYLVRKGKVIIPAQSWMVAILQRMKAVVVKLPGSGTGGQQLMMNCSLVLAAAGERDTHRAWEREREPQAITQPQHMHQFRPSPIPSSYPSHSVHTHHRDMNQRPPPPPTPPSYFDVHCEGHQGSRLGASGWKYGVRE